MINVNQMQEMIKELYNYEENSKKYIFYYDETNNYRKVRLSSKGFNDNKVLTDNFTLGGICIESEKNVDTNDLIKKIDLQKNQELKSKTFFKGMNEFESCICHPKIDLILDWILNNGYIHYSDIDAFYFTVLDIVDSVCNSEIGKHIPWDLVQGFKSELYILLRENIIVFLILSNNINYPNISSEDIKLFCDSIIELIDNKDEERFFTLDIFKELLREKRSDAELLFLKGNLEHTIIQSFHSLRQQKCIIFKNSYHIFDKEDEDEKIMKKDYMKLGNGEKLQNFEFKDSKLDEKLQISDIIVYLISKYLKFITYSSVQEINEKIRKMDKKGKENLKKIIRLIDKSNAENLFFTETVIAQEISSFRQTMHEHIKFLLEM